MVSSQLADGAVLLSSGGELLSANSVAREILGAQQTLQLERCTNSELARRLASVKQDSERQAADFDITWPHGQGTKIINVRITGLCEGDSVVYLQDVTEERVQDALRHDLIERAAYELRSPLTLIRGHAELLLDRGIADETTLVEALRQMLGSAEAMGVHIGELLDISRIEELATRQRDPLPVNDMLLV